MRVSQPSLKFKLYLNHIGAARFSLRTWAMNSVLLGSTLFVTLGVLDEKAQLSLFSKSIVTVNGTVVRLVMPRVLESI